MVIRGNGESGPHSPRRSDASEVIQQAAGLHRHVYEEQESGKTGSGRRAHGRRTEVKGALDESRGRIEVLLSVTIHALESAVDVPSLLLSASR